MANNLNNSLDFKTAFKYPFNRPIGMLNILWLLLPILGSFANYGYLVVIIRQFLNNDFKELPEFNFKDNLSLGFFMFLKTIPFILVFVVIQAISTMFNPLIGILVILFISLFILPILYINFIKNGTVGSFFDFNAIVPVFNNFGEYLIVLLKTVGLAILFLLMVLILVGFPAMIFTQNIFYADFYRKYVK
ncbi:DUF4013 domain-containing protein [Candidatus Woesearchaeota archaeon]|nr:DUF4013 domain-containing protein [Candidatus Woesearchaeota archaeon]